jgi:branched-chain amino acid transport system permease protein
MACLGEHQELFSMDYLIHLLIIVGIYLILVQSWNFTFGLGLLFNLSHVAACAIGAYTTALLSTELAVAFLPCLIASGFLSGLLAFPIGAISLRLSEDYFAIGSLAFTSVISAVLVNWRGLTNGVLGISGIPRPVIFGVELFENTNFLIFTWAIAIPAVGLLYLFFRNGFARQLRAQAQYETAALALGYNTEKIRLIAFCIASSLAGVAGSLFAAFLSYIDPSSFSFGDMVFVLTVVVVGRPGSFWGGVGATFFLVLLPEPLRFIDFPPDVVGPVRQLLYGVIMFFVVIWNRARLFPVVRHV